MKQDSRKRLLIYNSASSIVSQVISLACNFALTRLILKNFGSDTNGLVASITQFLGFIAFLEMGIGAVVKSALYKPLADHNKDQISRVIISTKNFYRKIAFILILYTIVLTIVFPILYRETYSEIYTGSLVLNIAISLFAQYYFGMPYQLLLNADQRTYIPTIICCATLAANTVMSAILIYLGASIQIVKLVASLIYVIRPVLYNIYVRKKYSLNEKLVLDEEPIAQKWNGLAQHLAYVVVNYTDIVVLTLLSSLANVSIYTVYHNVTIGIQQVISCVSVGISSMLGNVLYSESKEKLKDTFGMVEWFFHTITTLLFTVSGLLIIPFVEIYTVGVNDANYIVPLFAILIVIAQASYSIRTPYETMILSANHFKDTQKSAIIEMILNIGISIILVYKLGLIGVAVGTVVAMVYRTVYFVVFLSKQTELQYKPIDFVKNIVIDVIEVLVSITICKFVFAFKMRNISWGAWFILAIKVGIISLVVCLVINCIFNKKYFISFVKKIKR